MSSFDSPIATNASSSKFDSPSNDTLKRKGKRRMVNLVNPANMDDFSEPSLSLPDPATAFLSPIRPSSQHTPPESSTSPQCAPPSRLLREVTPVNDTPTSWADGDAAGSREVLTGTPVCKGSDGSGGSSSSGMSSSRMSDYGAVKGILRPQGTPGSGNGVRFGQKNRFRVITPNNSMSTYGTPPRPAPAPPSIAITPIPPIPPVTNSPRTSFFSSLLSVVPISSPLRTSFARPTFASPAPAPANRPSTPGTGGNQAEVGSGDHEDEDESQGAIEQSWEVPGEEGEVSLIGSSTGDVTRESEQHEEDEEESGELALPAVPWSGVPEVHSSPLSLPSATGDTSKDISIQDLSVPQLAASLGAGVGHLSPRMATSPAAPSAYSPASGLAPSPSTAPSNRRPRFSSGLHHVRNASTDSAALFNTRPSHAGIESSAMEGGGDVSNLLATTFDGMYGSMVHGMDTVDDSRMGMSFGSSTPGSPYPRVMAQEEGEGDSSFGLAPPREDDEPTVRRRLSVHGGSTARYDRSEMNAKAMQDGVSGVQGEQEATEQEERNPFAPIRTIVAHSPGMAASPDKSTLSPIRQTRSSNSISPDKAASASSELDMQEPQSQLFKKASISVDRERSRARSRSRSISPVKRDAPSSLFVNSSPSSAYTTPAIAATPQGTDGPVSPAQGTTSCRQPTPDSSPFSSLTPPSSDKRSNKFRSIFADMSAEQAQLQWPLQASTGNGGASSLSSRGDRDSSASSDARPSAKAENASPAGHHSSGMQEEASEGSMSLSPLILRSMRNGADVTNTTLPPRGTLPSANRSVRTPLKSAPASSGPDNAQTASVGDKTAFFTPSSTPCPSRAIVPFGNADRTDAADDETSIVQSAAAVSDFQELLATLNLSGPSIALVDAHTSHSSALEQQVELFRTLAKRLAEEVEERDRALAGVKVRLVQTEMRALDMSSRSRSESEEDRSSGVRQGVRVAHSRVARDSSRTDTPADVGKTAEEDREHLHAEREQLIADLEAERAKTRAGEEAAREREITAQVEMQQLRSQLSHVQHQLLESRESPHPQPHEGQAQARSDDAASLARAQDTVRDLEIRLRMSAEDVDRERRERQRGMERAEELEVVNAEMKEQVAEWKDRAESAEVELADARDKLDSVMEDEVLRARVETAEGQVRDARRGEEEARKEMEKERVASADLERIANELKLALEASQQEAKHLRAESSSKDLEISQLVRRKAELKQDREMLNIALDSKQQEVELLKRKLARAAKASATNVPLRSSAHPSKPNAASSEMPLAALGESHRTNLTELDQTPMPVPAHAQRVIDRQYDSVKPNSGRQHGGVSKFSAAGSIMNTGNGMGKMPAFPETPSVVPGGGTKGKVLVGSTVLKDRMLRRADAQQGLQGPQQHHYGVREGRASMRAAMGRESLPA